MEDQARMHRLVSKIERLLSDAPDEYEVLSTREPDYEWIGSVQAVIEKWDDTHSDSLNEQIGSLHTDSAGFARTQILILLARAKSSLEIDIEDATPNGATPPADYLELDEQQESEARQALAQFKEAVEASNTIDDEDRAMALSEIAVFEAALIQPRLSTDLINRFVGGVLVGIAKKLVGSTVDQAADRLIVILTALLVSG